MRRGREYQPGTEMPLQGPEREDTRTVEQLKTDLDRAREAEDWAAVGDLARRLNQQDQN